MVLPDPESIRQQMHAIRGETAEDVQALVDRASTITDWRHYVRQHPWFCLGAAALAGYLLVPRRVHVVQPNPAQIRQMVQRGEVAVHATAQPATPGLAATMLTTISAAVLRLGLAYFSQQAMQWLSASGNASPQPQRTTPTATGGSRADFNGLRT